MAKVSQPGDPRDFGEAMVYAHKLEKQRDKLREALISATASLAAADSAYAKYARRHGKYGKAEMDPFFSTRVSDFERAVEKALAALREIDNG